ncbi:MAG: LacI family DNA-binding transcriptional regulator [Rhodospirillaceae bacterium]
MSKPTVHDIAKAAGVSLATVDRVLNARPGVRDKTIAKVQDAVDRLGYVRDTSAANLARQRQYRFVFVLPTGPSQFIAGLTGALLEAYAAQIAERVVLNVVTAPTNDPHALVGCLRALKTDRLDGVAIMAPETPQVRDAIAHLKEKGLAVVALVSDLPNSQRDYFIGINNIAAGRTAALLMGRFAKTPGDILVVSHSLGSRDSLERRLGFDQVMASDFPALSVLPSVESYGDPERMEKAVATVARERPGLIGLYSMGAGNTPLLNGLRKSGRLKEVVVIAHEVTPTTRQALLGNEIAAVITQNVGHLVRSALRVLRALCDESAIYEAQERIRIEVVLRENLT